MHADDRYDSLFRWYGRKHGVSAALLKAMVRAESNFDPDAISPAGARGLAQFMDRTWAEWRDGTMGIQEPPPTALLDPHDPEDAIRAQAAMVSWLFRLFPNDRERVLASYNWGIGNVRRKFPDVSKAIIVQLLPGETKSYIERVLRFSREYEPSFRPAA